MGVKLWEVIRKADKSALAYEKIGNLTLNCQETSRFSGLVE